MELANAAMERLSKVSVAGRSGIPNRDPSLFLSPTGSRESSLHERLLSGRGKAQHALDSGSLPVGDLVQPRALRVIQLLVLHGLLKPTGLQGGGMHTFRGMNK